METEGRIQHMEGKEICKTDTHVNSTVLIHTNFHSIKQKKAITCYSLSKVGWQWVSYSTTKVPGKSVCTHIVTNNLYTWNLLLQNLLQYSISAQCSAYFYL